MPNQINTTQQRGEALAGVIRSYPEIGTIEQHISYAHALADLGIHVCVTPPDARGPFGDYRTPEQRAADHAAGQPKAGWYLGTIDKARLTVYVAKAHAETGQLPGLGIHIGPSHIALVDCDNEGDGVEWNLYQDRRCSDDGIRSAGNPFTVHSPGKIENGEWIHRDGTHCWYLLPDHISPDAVRPIGEKVVTGQIADCDRYPRAGWEIKCGVGKGALISPTVRAEGAYRPGRQWAVPVAPAWLLDLIAKPAPTPKPSIADLDDDTAQFHESVDDAMATVPWSEVMECTALEDGVNSCGCTIYTRPGGSRRSMIAHDGCDAVNGAHCVTVHSDTVMSMYPALQDILDKRGRDGKSFSKWEALAAFQHNGDMGAVAQQYGFSRSAGPAEDWSGVFVSNDLPFGVSLSWTPDGDDLCPHGAPHNGCVPCMSARLAEIIDGSA